MNTILSREARQGMGDVLRTRALAFGQATLRCLGGSAASIAIAVFLASYFLAAFVSAAGAR